MAGDLKDRNAQLFVSLVIGLVQAAYVQLGKVKNELTGQIENRFKSDSGVNVDRELALMIEIQNSYAASARVIQAVRDMFDELLRTAG